MNNNKNNKTPVFVLFAPTATGKTALLQKMFATSSLSFFKGEVISADSMQVYRNMNIGTAKPDKSLLDILPHHLIDVCDMSEVFSVSDFVENADKLCDDIFAKNKLPIIAGGTGFYIRCFLLGLPITPASDENIRKKIKKQIEELGTNKMWEKLYECDKESAIHIHKNDSYRIQRALEIYETTGKCRSNFLLNKTLREQYDFCTVIINMPRDILYERINSRVDEMFASGLVEEIHSIMKLKDCDINHNAFSRAIGYREWLCTNLTENEIRNKIKANSRAYAKKQYTYMKNIPNSYILEYNFEEDKMIKIIQKKLLDSFEKYFIY